MVSAQPHFFLFCDANASPPRDANTAGNRGRWHFVLEQLDGPERMEVSDSEKERPERLALLSVVRGLEALSQPSKVTLVTTSRYVSRGMRYGLATWRESGYKWERFGEQRPIRNADLWQRIDGALNFHGVTCRLVQSEATQNASHFATPPQPVTAVPSTLEAIDNEEITTVAPATEVGNATVPVAAIESTENSRWKLEKNHSPAPLAWQEIWWKLANTWIKWWRGRLQNRPVFYGT